MKPKIERKFVGWDRPLLHAVRDALYEGRGADERTSFSNWTVVLSGARAGRRLLELLSFGAEAVGGAVIPPRILTLGVWSSLALQSGDSATAVGTMARLAAWSAALGKMNAAERKKIAPVGDDAGEMSALRLLGVARMIDSCHRELSGELIRFDDVVRLGPMAQDFADQERWAALAEAQRLYEEELRRAGLIDSGLAAIERIARGVIDPAALVNGGRVMLAGISEMNAAARRIIDRAAGECVALIPAPPELADRFDEYGCVLPQAWTSVAIDVPENAVFAADGPEEQAATALRVIERFTGAAAGAGTPIDQITLGAADPEVEDRLRRVAGRLGGVQIRRAEGTPVSFTRPVRLLLAVADYLERRDFASLAALVRHPDVERWIAQQPEVAASGTRVERWLEMLDTYQAEHLHSEINGDWLTDDERVRTALDVLLRSVHQLLSDEGAGVTLLTRDAAAPATWCRQAWDVIRTVYTGQSSRGRSAIAPRLDPATREACSILQSHLAELASLPAELADNTLLTADETIRLVVQQAVGDAIPEPGDAPAIDMVGWLELAADDAPWLIVTGMNEGFAPSVSGIDPLVPESLRRALGIRDRRARFARDAFAMLVMLNSRPAGNAAFIFGRRSSEGDPLSPTRLLMMGDDEALLSRVRAWTTSSDQRRSNLMIRHAAAGASKFTGGLRILREPLKIEEMSITSFRHYLESPYGFYLRHVLRLDEIDDRSVELDALGFGNLIHDVVVKLIDPEMASCGDEERLNAFLVSQLDAVAAMRFGPSPRAEVWVQLEQARKRIRAFATVQAEHAAAGWRIARTEWAPPRRSVSLMVDEAPMYLRGRIDRIDVNPTTGEWMILDYKTSGKSPAPKDAFTRLRQWRDPQLPLYRHLVKDLAAELGVKGPPRLGWIAVPTEAEATGIIDADWDEAALALADQTAYEVVRFVRAGKFDELGKDPPSDGIIGLLCGRLEAAEDDE